MRSNVVLCGDMPCLRTKAARKKACCQAPIRVALNCVAMLCIALQCHALRCGAIGPKRPGKEPVAKLRSALLCHARQCGDLLCTDMRCVSLHSGQSDPVSALRECANRVALQLHSLLCIAIPCHAVPGGACGHRKAHVATRFPLKTLVGVVVHSAALATDTAPAPLLLVQTRSPDAVQR